MRGQAQGQGGMKGTGNKRVRSKAAVLLLALVFTSMAAAGNPKCKPSRGAQRDALDTRLGPGEYVVEFVATKGSRDGQRVTGALTLRPTSPDDRSPKTGEVAKDRDFAGTPLYGWLEADLGVVGAPICSDADYPGPAPDSRDPVYPGVLVRHFDWGADFLPKQPDGAPVLLVGTVGNPRNGEMWTDGCGIGMWVQGTHGGGGFRGKWREWGIVRAGRGYFCIYPATPSVAGDEAAAPLPDEWTLHVHSSGDLPVKRAEARFVGDDGVTTVLGRTSGGTLVLPSVSVSGLGPGWLIVCHPKHHCGAMRSAGDLFTKLGHRDVTLAVWVLY